MQQHADGHPAIPTRKRPHAVRVPGLLPTIDEPPAMLPGTPSRPSASSSRLLPGALRSPPGGFSVEDPHGYDALEGMNRASGEERSTGRTGILQHTMSGISYARNTGSEAPTTRAPSGQRINRGRFKVSIQGQDRPLPPDVDLSISGISDAWQWFCAADVDGSGEMEFEEFAALARRVGQKLSSRQLRMAFDDMLAFNRKAVNFRDFARWWARQQAVIRRDMRRTVRELFEAHDKDRSGILDKREFGQLVLRANKDSALPIVSTMRASPTLSAAQGAVSSAFDLEVAWSEIRKTPFAEGTDLGVDLPSFEHWWKAKVGINDPGIPVLPESMVQHIAVSAHLTRASLLHLCP